MAARPRLKPHARVLRRGQGALQVGVASDAGVVLEGLSEAEIALVARLDGSLDLPALNALAARTGVAPSRVTGLLQALRERHLLLDLPTDRALLGDLGEAWRAALEPDADALAAAYQLPGDGYALLAGRRRQHVVVSGEGALAQALASLLRAGGVGRVDAGPVAAEALDLDLRHDPGARVPQLVVLTAAGALASETGAPWLRRAVPHLPVVVQGHRVLVGPLVTPGRGPCLRCLDLHRCDRDPAWPALLAQLAPPAPGVPAPRVSPETTLTAVAAGISAMVVHTALDAQHVPHGVSLEVSLPWPRVEQRRWAAHPLCGCLPTQDTMVR
jgi:bacteriocin biosynthesis cyclodehydratase domain-containing protein